MSIFQKDPLKNTFSTSIGCEVYTHSIQYTVGSRTASPTLWREGSKKRSAFLSPDTNCNECPLGPLIFEKLQCNLLALGGSLAKTYVPCTVRGYSRIYFLCSVCPLKTVYIVLYF